MNTFHALHFRLNFLFEKNLERALRILDQGGVQRMTSEPSHRTVFQVIGESKGAAPCYLCFPDHYCSCQSFYFDVVAKNEQIYVSIHPFPLVLFFCGLVYL
jgi:predicted nucleic acid-binding Zn finger protein